VNPGVVEKQQTGHRAPANVTFEMLCEAAGRLADIARTPNGSSFLQAGLRNLPEAFEFVLHELQPQFSELLLDINACYVVRALMEGLSHNAFVAVVNDLAANEELMVVLCTQSLHSRRIVQFFLERMEPKDCHMFGKVMRNRCLEICTTQQGCISMQRALDRCSHEDREAIFAIIAANCVELSMDPYGNYLVQYLLSSNNSEALSTIIPQAFANSMIALCCNKFSSNVVEKCLHHLAPQAQHAMICALFNAPNDQILHLLQDSFGNYIVQTTIAVATYRDLWAISEKLAPLLHQVPYGQKLEARLVKRLNGKAIGSTIGTVNRHQPLKRG